MEARAERATRRVQRSILSPLSFELTSIRIVVYGVGDSVCLCADHRIWRTSSSTQRPECRTNSHQARRRGGKREIMEILE